MFSAYYISFNAAHLLVEEIAKPNRLALLERSAAISRKQTNISLSNSRKQAMPKDLDTATTTTVKGATTAKKKKNFFNILRIRCFLSKFPLKDTYSGLAWGKATKSKKERERERVSGSGRGINVETPRGKQRLHVKIKFNEM